MKLKQEARVLLRKALASLKLAMTAFNSLHDEGRTTQVLLSLQHAFEMLLKASLVQEGVAVFDRKSGRSIGFEACVRQASNSMTIKLADPDAGALRSIDAMRDDEQHWFNEVSEQLLYLHTRAGVTLFDDLLQRVFGEPLADHLPQRVLPLSVDPPRDLGVLVDEEFTQIAALLAPGRRARHEAQARIRTLLAMEAHVEPDANVSIRDVSRVEKGIKEGRTRAEVFPRLGDIATKIDGQGVLLTVHFTKKAGAPVRYVADDSLPAAAIREVDLQKKFYLSAKELADKAGLSQPRGTALRRHLAIDNDASARHVFVFGSQSIARFSDNALRRMKEAVETLDMDDVWTHHKPSGEGTSRPKCRIKGCAA
ncbi:hypothetical protein OG474_00575 [Kribbella sp. NBC_01505]|uniref:DUF3644 domain-containing protein n=1 Tax=Kribbella sp. NBC_01505 TaxID=2903580 RepID=UPI0038676E8A